MPRSSKRRLLPVFAWRQTRLGYGRILFLCGLLTLVASGCQRGPTWNLAPVEGTITKGGRPLPGILVVFLLDTDASTMGPRSSGRTDAAGHYHLRTDNGEEGVVTGKHRVLILDSQVLQGGPIGATARGVQQREEMARRLKEQKKMAESTPRVPPSYEQFKETPLRAEVHPGLQTLDFDLP